MAAAAKKNKGRVSKAEAEKRRRAERVAAQQKRRHDIAAIALFAFGALLFALTITDGAGVWLKLQNAFFGAFGVLAYVIGPIIAAIAVASALEYEIPIGKGICGVLIFFTADGAIYVFSSTRASSNFIADIRTAYEMGSIVKGGGGASVIVGRTLEVFCGVSAARILIVMLLFVLVLIITGRSLADLINDARKPIDKIKSAYSDHSFAAESRAAEAKSDDTAPWVKKRRQLFRLHRNIDVPIDTPEQPNVNANSSSKNNDDGPEILARAPKQVEVKVEPTAPTNEHDPKSFDVNISDVKPNVQTDSEKEIPIEPIVVPPPAPLKSSGKVVYGIKARKRIDIPLGPDFDPTVVEPISDHILTRGNTPHGPAADVITDVFGREKEMREMFTDFSSNNDNVEQDATDGLENAENCNDDFSISQENFEDDESHLEKNICKEKPEQEDVSFAPDSANSQIYHFPPTELLESADNGLLSNAKSEMQSTADALVKTLSDFGVHTRIVNYSCGPTVTRYELQPEPGVRLVKIVNLADDIALNLAAEGVRIEAPIPGKAAVGIEIPNKKRSTVHLRTVVESNEFKNAASKLTVALGQDIDGRVRVGNISKMPHLLIAGATGMGKSVCINSLILSLTYKSSPDEVQLVLIDPKVVEFACYSGLPHLHVPVVTDPKKAAGALAAAVAEMQRRYKLFAELKTRNIEEYNKLVEDYRRNAVTDEEKDFVANLALKPRLVIIIDELNDLMMTSPKEVEDSICRIAQMGRAAGVHLVVATQRPSVDVITGTIKNNIPTRIAFKVSSQVDSRTILDTSGAEKLIGNGDMLFLPVGATKPIRVQGCFVSDGEVNRVVSFLKKNGENHYNDEFIRETDENAARDKRQNATETDDSIDADPMLESAIETVVDAGLASTSLLQRRLRLGYSRATRIMDEMEQMGIIGPADGSRPREVKMTRQQYQERTMNLCAREETQN